MNPIKHENRDRYFLYLTFFFALILRIIPVVLSRDLGIGLDDMFQYDMLARSIVAGDGYRWYAQDDLDLVENYLELDLLIDSYDSRGVLTSFRAPLYPTFLAGIYWVFGIGSSRFYYVRMFQAILGALLVPLIYSISNILLPANIKVSRIAALIVAIYPILIIYPLALATENLFFFLVLLSLVLLLKAFEKRKRHLFLLSGIFLGLSILTRSVIILFAILVFLWTFFLLNQKKNAIVLLVGMIVLTLPWIIRNSLLHGRLMGIESSLGYNLYVGYHPSSKGTFQYGISMDLIPILDDGLRDEIGRYKTLEFIKADPLRFFNLLINRFGYFWGLEKRTLIYFYVNNFFGYFPNGVLLILSILLLSPFVIISITSVLGFSIFGWNKKNVILLLLIIGYLIPHVLILGESRFHLMLVPILAFGSALFWVNGFSMLNNIKPHNSGHYQLLLSTLIVGLLMFNWVFELIRDKQLLSAIFSVGGNTLYLPY